MRYGNEANAEKHLWNLESAAEKPVFDVDNIVDFLSLTANANLTYMSNNIRLFSFNNYFDALFRESRQNNILLIDERGIVLAINTAFTDCFGYEPEDVIGKNFSMFFTEADILAGKPEREVAEVLGRGQSFDNNYLVSKDGSITWVSGESVLVKSAAGDVNLLKIIQNIHRQKTSEISLQHLNEFNENILGAIEDAVLVLDPQLNLVKANRSFFTLFDLTAPHEGQINFETIVSTWLGCEKLVKDVTDTIRDGKPFKSKPFEIRVASGEQRVFDVSCSWLPHYDQRNDVLLVIHDITIHKQVEREREDVLGFVAHELRNPLANIVLCNDLMDDAIADDDKLVVKDLLQRSKNNVGRLNKMIAELYDATIISSGNMKLDLSTFNFGEMMKEAIETVEVLHPRYKIIQKGNADVMLRGDRYRLIQVVTNYLSNGIKYSDGKTDVLLNVVTTDDQVTVTVKDEGLGISQSQLPFIFDRFFRTEKAKNLEGIGLGLYLCRQIILAHNGKVWAESEEGEGSTFFFTIPR